MEPGTAKNVGPPPHSKKPYEFMNIYNNFFKIGGFQQYR
jgi:hypothetical protein